MVAVAMGGLDGSRTVEVITREKRHCNNHTIPDLSFYSSQAEAAYEKATSFTVGVKKALGLMAQ